VGNALQFQFTRNSCQEVTTKSTKDTKNAIRLKLTSTIGRVQERKGIVVSPNEAHSPKLNVAVRLFERQTGRSRYTETSFG